MAELTKLQEKRLRDLSFEGIDVNLSISLLEYDYLYSDTWEIAIIHRGNLYKMQYDWIFLKKQEIIEYLQELPQKSGFWSFVGLTNLERNNYIKEIVAGKIPYVEVIHSVEQYSGHFFEGVVYSGLEYDSLNDMLSVIEEHLSLCLHNKEN